MSKKRAPRALTTALSVALALAVCLGAAAAIAPSNPMAGFAGSTKKPAGAPTPEAVLSVAASPSPEADEIDADDEIEAAAEADEADAPATDGADGAADADDEPATDDEIEAAAEADEADALIENPTEEELFLSDLMNELDVNDANALDKVNGMTHILLVGIDARPGQKTGRSDTMMLLTIDPDLGNLKLTSFMRDLYVEIPGRKNNRLNSAYVFGGPELLLKALKKNFGVGINYYAAVNFSLLADLIDQIGGLEVNIKSKTQMKYINLVIMEDNVVLKKAYPKRGIKTKDNLLTKTGRQLLNGRQAQAYARYRKGSSDFERTERQRDVVLKAMEKVRTLSMMDLGKLALDNLDKLDTNLTVADILRLAPAALQLQDAQVKQLRIPVDGGYASKTISGMSVLVPNRAKNVSAITKFLLK